MLGRCKKTLARHFQFIFDTRLGTHTRTTLSRDALVDRDAVQPRRDFCLAAKVLQVAECGNERLLRSVARVLRGSKDAVGESENLSLPATHNFTEGFLVSAKRALN